MFDHDYTFRGKHSNIVTQLTTEIDSETKFKLFDRNIDVLILAPIVGFLYGRMANIDNGPDTANIKKINFEQLTKESSTLNFNYQLIMLLHDKNSISIENRLDRAFRYADESKEKEECNKIYEQYLLGGIEVLGEKLLGDSPKLKVDEYVINVYNFVSDYNKRYNETMTLSDDEMLKMCMDN